MKLYGSRKRKKKPVDPAVSTAGTEPKSGGAAGENASDSKKRKKALRRALTVIGVIVLVVVGVVVGYSVWEKPPDTADKKIQATPTPTPTPKPTATPSVATPEPSEEPDPDEIIDDFDGALMTDRDDGIYTFLLVGRDHESNSTDTVLIGRLDTNDHTINCVNIPRDTMINISWGSTPKKINAVYPGYSNSGKDPVAGLKTHVKNILGFEVDCYAIVNLKVVEDVINEVGGVDFDVPIDMDYDDGKQHFHVHLKAGEQHLNGYETLGVFRYRYSNTGKSYPRGDLQRIEVQQSLLKAIATQMLSLGNIPNLPNIIQLCLDNVETDLDASNMAFFARQFLMCSSENITFQTVPLSSGPGINNISYVCIDVDPWLEMVNEYLNPYKEPVTKSNVNILVSNGSGSNIYSTTGTVAGGYGSFACNTAGCELRGKYHAPGAHIMEAAEGEGEGEGTGASAGEGESGNASAGGETTGGETTGGETAGGETIGGGTTGGDASGGDTSGGDTSGGDASGGNTSGGDTSGGDTSGGDTSGGDTSGGDTSGGDASGGDASGGDTSGGTAEPPAAGEPSSNPEPQTAPDAGIISGGQNTDSTASE